MEKNNSKKHLPLPLAIAKNATSLPLEYSKKLPASRDSNPPSLSEFGTLLLQNKTFPVQDESLTEPSYLSTHGERRTLSSRVKTHLAETMGLGTVALPIYRTLETSLVGMPHIDSLETRLIALGLGVIAVNYIFRKGRELSHRALHIYEVASHFVRRGLDLEKNVESAKKCADTMYCMSFNFIAQPLFFMLKKKVSGETIDYSLIPDEALIGAALGAATGALVCWGMDVSKELYGCERSLRVPDRIRYLPPYQKAMLAASGSALAAVLTFSGVQSVMPDSVHYQNLPPEEDTRPLDRPKERYERTSGLIGKLVENYYHTDISDKAYYQNLQAARRRAEKTWTSSPVDASKTAALSSENFY